MTATTDTPILATGPIVCQPWCIYGDGHRNALFADDQYCVTDELFVPISTAEPVDVSPSYGDCKPERLHVYGVSDRRHPEPRIVVNVDGGAAPPLTLDEAQELVETVQLILGQVTA